MTRRTPETTLRTALDRLTARRGGLPAPQVLVRAPGWEFTYGDQDQRYHSASVGKLMTATLVAILAERGRLALDAPIGTLLPASDVAGLPAAPGADAARDVTADHLLTSTSGLPDYFEPPRGHGTGCSIRTAPLDPDRYWPPSDILGEVRRLPAVGRPGARFHYADTNYVLLGRIVEEATGTTFGQALREHVLEPAGMTTSSTPYSDARTPADVADLDVAPAWIGRHDLRHALCLSLDFAGGNIVQAPADLVRFQEALHGGRLIGAESLAHLTRPRHRVRQGIWYGAGSMTLRFGEFAPFSRLPRPVGHLGVWATHMFYYPDARAHVVLNFHSTREMSRSFLTHLRIARILTDKS
ncbi:serine hydrolase domain-containing protein [Myceligenerans crystallogenes]|uniref:Serine hydrolase domain-containing protein n=1 Tax=Myceligenerans crystallogenes TaxID=316335 RepID=A0ABP4ZFI1_9MICO